jgi:hypothetical protein
MARAESSLALPANGFNRFLAQSLRATAQTVDFSLSQFHFSAFYDLAL